jgi:hypothetical protein
MHGWQATPLGASALTKPAAALQHTQRHLQVSQLLGDWGGEQSLAAAPDPTAAVPPSRQLARSLAAAAAQAKDQLLPPHCKLPWRVR